MSNIVYETAPRRYTVERRKGDEWRFVTSTDSLDDAVENADAWSAEMGGMPYRVVDTQAEPAVDEAVREPDNKIGTLYVDIVPALNATCKENAGEFTDPAEPVNKTGRFDEGDLRHALDIAFAGFWCACDACAEFEAACTARERGSEPTSEPCESEPVSDPDSFGEYQEQAKVTAVFTHDRALEYLALGLTSEAGEVAGKVKKIIRDHDSVLTRELRDDLASEVGDVLWYVAVLAGHLGFDLSDVADLNIRKLQDRQARGVLGGSGDDR